MGPREFALSDAVVRVDRCGDSDILFVLFCLFSGYWAWDSRLWQIASLASLIKSCTMSSSQGAVLIHNIGLNVKVVARARKK
jgi:hypothetical protein